MVVPSPSPSKAQLRGTMRARRRAFVEALSGDERTLLETRLADRLEPLLATARIVGGYCPIGSEISPLIALKRSEQRGATLAFPAFADPAEPFCFRAGHPAAVGPFGIPEPRRDAPQVLPDLVLVPLLAIDAAGNRLGQGGGHYDRVLGPLRDRGSRLIGLGWPLQRLDVALAAQPWDVPLDGFCSPDALEILR